MPDGLTPFVQGVRNDARAVAREVTAKVAVKHGAEYTVPMETMGALHKAGLHKLSFDRRLGDDGTGMLTGVDPLVIEELARIDMSAADCFQVDAHTCQMLTAAGTDDQKERYLQPALERGALFSWTGSDPGRTKRGQYALVSDAKRSKDRYLLNGVKNFATLANKACWNVVAVTVSDLPSSELRWRVDVGANRLDRHSRSASWNDLDNTKIGTKIVVKVTYDETTLPFFTHLAAW